jgi:hypothetical protein
MSDGAQPLPAAPGAGARPLPAAPDVARSLNPTPFLNRAAVRQFLLDFAKANRAHKFERVSAETLLEVNEAVRHILMAKVRQLPSKGRTI